MRMEEAEGEAFRRGRGDHALSVPRRWRRRTRAQSTESYFLYTCRTRTSGSPVRRSVAHAVDDRSSLYDVSMSDDRARQLSPVDGDPRDVSLGRRARRRNVQGYVGQVGSSRVGHRERDT